LKPRRESAVLTRDDTKIWLNINLPMRRKAPHPLPSRAYFESDRRDAELMLDRERFRQHCANLRVPQMPKIWLNINLPMRRKAPHRLPSRAYFESDRRDAELMLDRERFRQHCANLRVPQMRPRIWWFTYVPGAV
jgi:hypothetical protein